MYDGNSNSRMAHQQIDGEADEVMELGDAQHQDQNYHFYKEYCRLYYANIILTNRLQQLLNEKQDLGYKLTRLEVSILFYTHIINLIIFYSQTRESTKSSWVCHLKLTMKRRRDIAVQPLKSHVTTNAQLMTVQRAMAQKEV